MAVNLILVWTHTGTVQHTTSSVCCCLRLALRSCAFCSPLVRLASRLPVSCGRPARGLGPQSLSGFCCHLKSELNSDSSHSLLHKTASHHSDGMTELAWRPTDLGNVQLSREEDRRKKQLTSGVPSAWISGWRRRAD